MSTSRQKVIKLNSDPGNLQGCLKGEITPFLQESGLEEKVIASIIVALGEAITNATRHSYGGEKGKPIEITLEDSSDKVVVRIRDYGKKIDLKGVKEPIIPPVQGGGLGIYFMKTIMDDLQYNTAHAEGNELIMTKSKGNSGDENPNQKK